MKENLEPLINPSQEALERLFSGEITDKLLSNEIITKMLIEDAFEIVITDHFLYTHTIKMDKVSL